MKTKVLIPLVFLMFPLISMGQKEIIDNVYFKAGDVVKTDKSSNTKKPNIDKNGAKEIIFTTNDSSYVASQDTAYLVAEANDSTETDQGYYLNGFNGTKSDLEYADRIRKFHDPRFRVFVGDPNYNDIYMLNDWDWNVYVDGTYAYVTPTWTNPYWFDYMYSPYTFGYNGWYWRSSLYNPYYYGYYYSPYYYGSNYGYGWNNPYYGGYYSWWSQNYNNNYNVRNRSDYRNQNENPRWADNNSRNPMLSPSGARTIAGSSTISGSRVDYNSSNSRHSYTTLSDNNRVFRNASGTRVINGNTGNNARSSYRNSSVENSSISRNMGINSTRSINSVSTRSRTTYTQNSDPAYTTNNIYRSTNTTGTNSNSRSSNTTGTNSNSRSASYSTPRTSYSTGTPYVRSSSSGSSASTRSSSYSSPTSTRSSESYSNSSSSSSSSRSSGSSSSGSAGRSSGGNGGRR